MRWLAVILGASLLAGCFTSGKRGSERGLTVHDLGLQPPLLVVDGQRRGGLAIEVRAPLWMDSLGIVYRLTYGDASQLREYARSRWAGPPAQLIEQRLLQQLDLVPSGQARGKCVLRLELAEFSQVFASPAASVGLLQGRVFWLDPRRQPLAEKRLVISRAAASADAQGGVAALQASVDQLANELLAWEQELLAGGQTKPCAD